LWIAGSSKVDHGEALAALRGLHGDPVTRA
jgi:hypothetical protein